MNINISKELKQFVKSNIETINSYSKPKWQSLYNKLEDFDGDTLPGDFGRLMLEIDVNVPQILDYVPRRFLQFQTDITQYSIPEGSSYVGMSAFEDSSLSQVIIPRTVTELDFLCFAGSKLKTVYVPESVTAIRNSVFHSCLNLEQVILTGVKILEDCVFEDCIHLTKVFLNKDIITIWADCFNGCTRLKELQFEGTVEEFKSKCIDVPQQDITVKCVDGEYLWSSKFVDEED